MKKNDLLFVAFMAALFLPFFVSADAYAFYNQANAEHGMLLSFLKFALLATAGEMLGLRIRTGSYNQPGFGILPRAIVWGLLGFTIKLAFVIFGKGTPAFLTYMGLEDAGSLMGGAFGAGKLLVAFSISAAMNLIYAPVMMTLHKITDTHILNNGGTVAGLFKPIRFGDIMASINWQVQWNFVFKKTIPFFWIPAHTITFLLPEQFQVLFAALLGIALGVILAVASLKGRR